MKTKGWGRIVNIAGASGTSPTPDNLPVSLAIVTVHNLTRALSDELSPFGVRVNLVSPGPVLTDRLREMFERRASDAGITVEESIERFAADLPARRPARPEEIARTVAFLASDAASYVFGSALYADGGARRATP